LFILIDKSICVYEPADASYSHARCARDAVTLSFSELSFGKRYRCNYCNLALKKRGENRPDSVESNRI